MEEEINKHYKVTNCGKVFSTRRNKYLKPYKTGRIGNQYLCISLNGKNIKIHSLVAEKFIDNKENKPQVNHIDGNTLKSN